MDKITQTARYRQALILYAEKHGVTKASIRYHTNRQYIYRWRKRYDGTLKSLEDRSYRPHSYPNQHGPEEVRLIQNMRRRNPSAGLTDNGSEFTNRLNSSATKKLTLFEKALAQLGIRHKLIRPFTPRHNGKVERSHRKDNEVFYASHKFFSFQDFQKQLAVRQRQYNDFPLRPLAWRSPHQVLSDSVSNH